MTMITPGEVPADDQVLVRAFVDSGDQTAFATLVQRYAGLVHGVCRRILRDPHAADDATQATFLVLARKAGHLHGETSLAGWLYRTAGLCARTVRREQHRRALREQAVARTKELAMSAPTGIDPDISAHLDAALAALPDGQRAVIVERVLCGRSEAEAGMRLGLSRSAVSVRLARGLSALRERLASRGVALPAAALASILAAEAAHAAPATTVAISQAVGAGTVSPNALSTAEHTMRVLFWSSPKLAAIGVGIVAGLMAITASAMQLAGGEAVPAVAAPAIGATPAMPAATPWTGLELFKLADDAARPSWSADGRRLAWLTIVEAPDAGGVAAIAPGGPARTPKASRCAVGIADLTAGINVSVDVLRDAPPLLGVAWFADGGAVLAWDAQRIWRIDGIAAGRPVLGEPVSPGPGRTISAVIPAPAGGRWLCVCSADAGRERQEDRLWIDNGRNAPPVDLSGRRPLWSPDGGTLYFGHDDGVWAWTGSGPARPLFTAAQYATHPHPKAVEPRAGFRHEVWPVATRDGGGLVAAVVEVQSQAEGFGPSQRWPYQGEVVTWRPMEAAITNNGNRLPDAFQVVARIDGATRTLGPNVDIVPVAGNDRFLRIEHAVEEPSVITHRSADRLRRTLVMTIESRSGTILRTHDLPFSHPLTITTGAGQRETNAAVTYRDRGVDADGGAALFAFASVQPTRNFPISGRGLVWIDPATGAQRWLEFPREVCPEGTDRCDPALAPRGRWVAVATLGSAVGRGNSRALWLVNPDSAGERPAFFSAGVRIAPAETLAQPGAPEPPPSADF